MANKFYDSPEPERSIQRRSLKLSAGTHEPARTNYFTIYWFRSGHGSLSVDDVQVNYAVDQLAFITPYQYLRFEGLAPAEIEVIEFHANFLCIETFHSEVGCSGTLFNDPLGNPMVTLEGANANIIASHFESLTEELTHCELAYLDAALARLKLLLILATRCKSAAREVDAPRHTVPETIGRFAELVEANYAQWHSPGEYAAALYVTPKTLARLSKTYLGTTPTDFVRRRILIHAKWQLLHTLRPVKEISYELGFQDELYFSRLFRKSVGVSPSFFRDFETKIREGRNLSMPLE